MYKTLICLAVIVSLSSCVRNAGGKIEEEIVDLVFDSKYMSDYDSLHLIDSTTLVCLQEDRERELQMAQIDKICVKNNRIYVADTYLKRLIVFDSKGAALCQVGSLGSGPGEYSSIADFCVTDSCLYLYDSAKRKMILYDNEYRYLKDFDIEFSGEFFVRLADGNFLFSLAPYNEGELERKKIAITDNSFHVTDAMFDFEENIDLNYQMLSPLVESDGRIVYNRGISNDIYLFAKDGTFEKMVRLDFGSHNVPADELNDLSKFMESSGDYCYIASTPVFMKDAILFILNKNNELYTCVYDLKRGRSYLNSMANYSTRTVNLPFSVAGEDVIVSYFNADIYPGYEKDEALSDSVKEEIASGANVVCLYHVRK